MTALPASAAGAPDRLDAKRLFVTANVLLPGVYAWASTVALPAAQRGATTMARVTAALALVAIIAGPLLRAQRPRLARAVGILGFVGLCCATWALLGPQLDVRRLEPVRAFLGSIGWALFALGWGAGDRPREAPGEDRRIADRDRLAARSWLPFGTELVFAFFVGVALVPTLLAWGSARPDHALLAHAAALACAIAVVTAGAAVALGRGRWQPASPRLRLTEASIALAAAAVLAALGLIALMIG